MKLFDRVLLGTSIAMLTAASVILVRKNVADGSISSPRALSELRGLRLPFLSTGDSTVKQIPLTGRTHVLYVFSTTCGFCEQQRGHVAELLGALEPDAVVTASQEPAATTRGYWKAVGSSLPDPVHLRPETSATLGLPGTPALVFVSPAGKVVSTYLGTVLQWSSKRIRQELEKAATGP